MNLAREGDWRMLCGKVKLKSKIPVKMSKHKACLHILPPMELQKNAWSALWGARHHFEKARELVRSPGVATRWQEERSLDTPTRSRLQDELNRFHWQLRAFFWELVATFDTVLHWVNQKLGLSIHERDVRWEKVKDEAKKQNKRSKELGALKTAYDSEWFFEVGQYRNFAHRAFLFVQGEYDTENKLILLWFLPARVGQRNNYDALARMSDYLDQMRKVLETIFPQ